MEALLQAQADAIKKLNAFVSSYPKYGPDRRTIRFYEGKIEELEKWKKAFDANNHKLRPFEPMADQPYFINNVYRDSVDSYKKHMEKVRKDFHFLVNNEEEQSNRSHANMGASTSNASFSAEIGGENINVNNDNLNGSANIHTNNYGSNNRSNVPVNENSFEMKLFKIRTKELEQIFEDIQNQGDSQSRARANMELLKISWNDFRAMSIQIQTEFDSIEISSKHGRMQRKYADAMEKLNDVINNKVPNIELPKIRLPEFSGKPTEWRNFIGLFNKIVHSNGQLNESIKMQYLKTSLKGDAANLVSHVSPSEENYKICYDILTLRYDNKRELLGNLFDSILNAPKHKSENSADLRKLHDTANESILEIGNLGIDTTNWDAFINHILLSKLHRDTIKHYECQLDNVKETESLREFLAYIESRCLALQSAETHETKSSGNSFSKDEHKNSKIKCLFCNEEHPIWKCQKFLKKEPSDRNEFIKQKKVCINCFGNHKFNECKSKLTCKTCKRKHNSLIHLELNSIKTNIANLNEAKKDDGKKDEKQEMTKLSSNFVFNSSTNMLATAILAVENRNGERVAMKAIIDQGSQASFISANALQALNLYRHKIQAEIGGIGASTTGANYAVELRIHPYFDSGFVLTTNAVVLKRMTDYSINLSGHNFDHLNNLLLADPSFRCSSDIDILLGVAELARILKTGVIKNDPDEPIAQNTELGWIITGPVSNKIKRPKVLSMVSNMELEKKLSNFFESSFPIESSDNVTSEEALCEQHFRENVSRDTSGRYVVGMPFKGGNVLPDLGDSRKVAVATQHQLERRFERKPKLKIEYEKFIDEYLNLGHMELVPYENVPPNVVHYLPHHCVFKESTTTKLRVVFNASMKTENGKCLNEQLASGNCKQPDMLTIMIRFRVPKYAFSADIEKMYRQILIQPSQRDLLRIVWRNDPSQPMRNYRLKTITYGTANAPYLAIRTLQQLATDIADVYPRASNVIKNHMYVDDAASGEATEGELIETYQELKKAFDSAGFNLRKWCSNSPKLLALIPECDREMKASISHVKTLGVAWTPNTDDFSFEFNVPQNSNPTTKRNLLSEIASLFDPLGWISPVVIGAKNLLQELWKLNIDWDEKAPGDIIDRWLQIKNELHLLSNLKIPRWIKYVPRNVIELHGFCDASFLGYAAVIYIKNVELNTVSLLLSKAKVAPLRDDKTSKEVTIPRLELSAAALLAELFQQVKFSMNIDFNKTYFWSDSQVALAWINSNPKRYKVFVANKIAKIQELTSKDDWAYVASGDNPADCASRGILPSQLVGHHLWWNGPQFLKNESISRVNLFTTNELVNITSHIAITSNSFLPHVSSYYKLKRIMSFVSRFISNCKNKTRNGTPLTASELRRAEVNIIKIVQSEEFEFEIKTLKKARDSNSGDVSVSLSSKYIKLSPYLHEGILKVGGRLSRAKIPFNAKHQILLPNKHFVTDLIIRAYHLSSLHGGPRLTECSIRQKFWLINSQHEIKRVLNKCIVCFKQKKATMTQVMADLPAARVQTFEKPFTNVAVDYSGAINYKLAKGRGYKTSKAYIAIFVCMSTKAVHIELVSDLTAEACIAAFRRLIARRGNIKNVYSDNGTNFVKANKDLFQICGDEFLNEFSNELAKMGTTWNFSPAGAPHFNGLAEAAVKSVKNFLRKSMGNLTLTFEELSTLLCQIEASVNSRPLCQLSSDPNEPESLTPGHLLIGAPLLAPPDENLSETNSNWLNKWQQIQKMHQAFWRTFRHEYLNEMQMKGKWYRRREPPKVNDIVLVKEENVAPSNWPLARIIKIHPGDDNLPRVVTLRLKGGTFQRPITKIAPLPIETESNESVRAHITHTRSTKPKVFSVILAMMSLFGFGAYSFPVNNTVNVDAFNITRFQTPPGLYFEKTKSAYLVNGHWNLIAFLNLNAFNHEYEMLNENCVNMNKSCALNYPVTCSRVLKDIEIKLARISELNNIIFNKPHVNKRAAFNFVGNVLGDLLGVLDSRFAEKYMTDMSQLNNNDDHIMSLLRNHTSVMDATLNILKHDESEIVKINDRVNHLFKLVKDSRDDVQRLNLAALQFNQALNEFETLQLTIIDMITNAHHSRFDHKLFPPNQVNQQLKVVSDHVKNKFLVPEGHDLYKLIEISPMVLSTQIVFIISIPLFKLESFGLYKIVEVPSIHEHQLWWIKKENDYLLASVKQQLFQFMSEFDLSLCIEFKLDIIACRGPRQWKINSPNCEWNLFNQLSNQNCSISKGPLQNVWLELNNQNQWIFVISKSIKLTVICNNVIYHDEISGEGILELKQGCLMKNHEFQLETKQTFSSNQFEIIIPTINHSILVQNHDSEYVNFHEYVRSNFSYIDDKLSEIKRQSVLPTPNVHDAHHYFMTYLIILCICIIMIIVLRKIKKIEIKNVSPTFLTRRVTMPAVFARENVSDLT